MKHMSVFHGVQYKCSWDKSGMRGVTWNKGEVFMASVLQILKCIVILQADKCLISFFNPFTPNIMQILLTNIIMKKILKVMFG